MSAKHNHLIVVLDHDCSADELQPLMAALAQLKGVHEVHTGLPVGRPPHRGFFRSSVTERLALTDAGAQRRQPTRTQEAE